MIIITILIIIILICIISSTFEKTRAIVMNLASSSGKGILFSSAFFLFSISRASDTDGALVSGALVLLLLLTTIMIMITNNNDNIKDNNIILDYIYCNRRMVPLSQNNFVIIIYLILFEFYLLQMLMGLIPKE